MSITELPIWFTCLVLFLIFAAVALLSRAFARKKLSDAARNDIESHAGKMIAGFAASFAFFTGVAISMTWGALSSAQSAVEDLTAKSEQVGWAIGNITDQEEAENLQQYLNAYLQSVIGPDRAYLAAGSTADLPSDQTMDKMQDAIHAFAYAPRTPNSESTALVSSAQALGTSNATFAAVAERAMPGLMALLLLVTATLLSITVGLSSISIQRPFLAVLWCFLIALSISLVFALDHPFGGDVTVNLQPLIDYANAG